jgi:hypothetical protein
MVPAIMHAQETDEFLNDLVFADFANTPFAHHIKCQGQQKTRASEIPGEQLKRQVLTRATLSLFWSQCNVEAKSQVTQESSCLRTGSTSSDQLPPTAPMPCGGTEARRL